MEFSEMGLAAGGQTRSGMVVTTSGHMECFEVRPVCARGYVCVVGVLTCGSAVV